MKPLNINKANLLLLFTRRPASNLLYEELEYYTSDDNTLMGIVLGDRVDKTFHAILLDRNSLNRYQIVDFKQDLSSLEEARSELELKMKLYVRNEDILKKDGKTLDFFTPQARLEQLHPFFKGLLDNNGFFVAAREVIRELSYHFDDKDGNFVDQFQSLNGFDARIWELYLWCYLREEGFEFRSDYNDAPDFLVSKGNEEVAIEAVHIKRKQSLDDQSSIPTYEEIELKIKNEIPLMYGSSLFSKLNHACKKNQYWNLPHVKGKPLVFAIADFHGNMSMTYSFPGIVSILYGVEQRTYEEEDGSIKLENEAGIKFQKRDIGITPIFLDPQFRTVSAIMFSPCGTLSKFNRMGVQAGYGNKNNFLYQIKICYNSDPDAIMPNVIGEVVDEDSHETWADGIQIFHNPFADIPLDATLFPSAGHHYYKDGFIVSNVPNNHIITTTTYNIKNLPITLPSFNIHSSTAFDEVVRKWRMSPPSE